MSKIDTERLREHFTSGKHLEIYGEGTLEAYAVLSAAPELLDEIERLTKDALKASTEAGRLKLENNQWNDTDCNTCPLRTWSECDEICISKATMAERMAELANDIDIKLDALLKAESDRDHLKAQLDENERLREANEEIAKYCCEQYEVWKGIRNDPNSDNLRQDKAASSMLAYLDVGRRLDRSWRGKDS